MNKNGKIFVAPPGDGSDFKELFKQMVAAGAGRPLDDDGFPQGPWTPELLAEAIAQVDIKRAGVDLRTVQLWFQENDKGISASNIRWLARIFGCDDPEATSEWQKELSEAQSRLTAKRRGSRRGLDRDPLRVPDQELVKVERERTAVVYAAQGLEPVAGRPRFRLAIASEKVFSAGSPLNLPSSIFAGASALGFLSYIVGIHSATYVRSDGIAKQVGFLWAPNWTFLFMVLLPLFFAIVVEVLVFWKQEGRPRLLADASRFKSDETWARNVQAYSSSYWAVFVICVVVAGVLQWIGVCLIPLLEGGDDYATSWGTLAIVQPEVISVPMSIVFTALAYLYMCLCFYLFFAGLILLHTIIHDLWKIDEASATRPGEDRFESGEIGQRVLRGIFRCTVIGVLVAVSMKIQSAYLSSNGGDILAWMAHDISSAFYSHYDDPSKFVYRMPTHYSSLLVAMSACFVFLYGWIRLGTVKPYRRALWRMSAVVGLLFVSYLLIDAFEGFSILLGIGVLLATYGLFDPDFGRWRKSDIGSKQRVS